MAALTVFASLGYVEAAAQPQPSFAVLPAPDVQERYLQTQLDPGAGDIERIQAAVDSYFTLKYESLIGGKALDLGIVIDSSDSRGRDLYNYEMGRLQYYLAAWDAVRFHPSAYEYLPEYSLLKVQGNVALVEVKPYVNVTVWPLPFMAGSETHALTLVRGALGWVITDDRYTDPFSKAHPRGTDFADLICALPAELADCDAQTPTKAVEGEVGILSTYRPYDRGNACWYAETYALYYNSPPNSPGNFESYVGQGGDCQNFASQAIWYGFGGLNIYTPYISGHSLPMMDDRPGGPEWWQDRYNCDAGYNWINVGYFKTMATDNYSLNRAGVQAYLGTLTTSNCDCDYGDWVAIYDYSHAMIITSLPDADVDIVHDYNEIYICGHTNDQLNLPLVWNCPSPSNARLLKIYRFKNPD